jgi:hypothetical protein
MKLSIRVFTFIAFLAAVAALSAVPQRQLAQSAPAQSSPQAPASAPSPADCAAETKPTRALAMIAADTQWQTSATTFDSGKPGPVVLVVAGMEGTAHGPRRAAAAALDWQVSAGKLIIIPEANIKGCASGRRDVPGLGDACKVLDTCFPAAAATATTAADARGVLAMSLWRFIESQHPAWVVTLSEAENYHLAPPRKARISRTPGHAGDGQGADEADRDEPAPDQAKPAVPDAPAAPTPSAKPAAPEPGNTVMLAAIGSDDARATASRIAAVVAGACAPMVPTTDADEVKSQAWEVTGTPAAGSLAGAASRLNSNALTITTTRKDTVARRARCQRLALAALLRALGMTTDASLADKFMNAPRRPGETRVAVYDDSGTDAARKFEGATATIKGATATAVCAGDIRGGALANVDVAIFGGGSGSAQAAALGKEGQKIVTKFVADGGGYVGVCAGAYLATCHYSWSLGILDAAVLDTAHWLRGRGTPLIEFTQAGAGFFGRTPSAAGATDKTPVVYHNGPLLGPANRPEIPDYEVLTIFRGDVADNVPGGVMPGTAAMVKAPFGKGRVFVSSPHPEQTKGLEGLVSSAIRWTAAKEAVKEPAKAEAAPAK